MTLVEQMKQAGYKPVQDQPQSGGLLDAMKNAGYSPKVVTPPAPAKKSFWQQAGEFVAPLGKVLGESFAQKEASKMQEQATAQQEQNTKMILQRLKTTSDPVKRSSLIQALQRSGQTQTIQEQTPGYNTTNRQVIGSGLTTLGSALGGGSLGAKSLLGAVAENAVGGSVFGVGGAMERNAGTGETIASGALGGALGAGGVLAGKLASKAVSRLKLPENSWSLILKQSPTEVAKNPKLAQQVAETGVTGLTRKSLSKQFGGLIQDVEVKLDDLLQNKQGNIQTQNVAKYLDELKSAYSQIPGEIGAVNTIDNIANDLLKRGNTITIQDANKLKRGIYQLVEKSYGKGLLEAPAKIEAQKILASGLKQEIEKLIPEVKGLNKQQAVYIQAKKAIDKAITRTSGKGIAGTGIGMLDILSGGVGAVSFGGPAGVATILGVRGLKSAGFLSVEARAVTKLIQEFDRMSPTRRMLFYQFLNAVTSGRQKGD